MDRQQISWLIVRVFGLYLLIQALMLVPDLMAGLYITRAYSNLMSSMASQNDSLASSVRQAIASEKRPGLGLQNPLPPNAKVAQNRDIDHLYLEWLIIELKPEQFARMAQSRNLEFQIGRTKFPFTDSQMNTIRAFSAMITLK